MLKSAPFSFSFDDFSQGLDWSGNLDREDTRVVLDAKNFNLSPYKSIEKRGGCSLLYDDPLVNGTAADIRSIYEHVKASDGTRILLVQTSTILAYNDGATWNNIKTGLTEDARLSFARHRGFTFCVNGVDANFKISDTTTTAVGGAVPTAPTTAEGTATGLTGKYRYKVTAYRSSTPVLETNGSASSASRTVSDKKIVVTYTAHSDAQFDKLRIYRTFDETDGDLSIWYLLTTVNNANGTYTDSTPDSSLGAECPITHAKPPLAKFCLLHKNRMIYANCPALEDGESVFVFSEVGEPEYAQVANYQYFDRRDGDEITGVASLPDYLLVFKKNKIAVMEGDFQEWFTISPSLGCVAPWSIVAFVDKVMFMSDEGWKITDGRSIFDVSKRLSQFIQSGACNWANRLDNSGVYYPARKQAIFLMHHLDLMMIGHVLSSMYNDAIRDGTVDEPFVGWTYHQYPNQKFTCLGAYTDSTGLPRVAAGTDGGYIYMLDDGFQDNNNSIQYALETMWTTFTLQGYKSLRDFTALTKVLRMVNMTYSSGDTDPRTLEIDVDGVRAVDTLTFAQGDSAYIGPEAYCGELYCGGLGFYSENQGVGANNVGRKFKFRLLGDDSTSFNLMELNLRFRLGGLREGVL